MVHVRWSQHVLRRFYWSDDCWSQMAQRYPQLRAWRSLAHWSLRASLCSCLLVLSTRLQFILLRKNRLPRQRSQAQQQKHVDDLAPIPIQRRQKYLHFHTRQLLSLQLTPWILFRWCMQRWTHKRRSNSGGLQHRSQIETIRWLLQIASTALPYYQPHAHFGIGFPVHQCSHVLQKHR